MAKYNYKEGRKRVLNIFGRSNENIANKFPIDKNMTFNNKYRCRITAMFVDIRKSTSLFKEGEKDLSTPKIIRCFTSEAVEILNSGGGEKEIGIRGDCVYGIYHTPKDEDVLEVVEKAKFINTLIAMLNSLFKDNNLKPLKVGIGISTSTLTSCNSW